jgi:hypothetical protein
MEHPFMPDDQALLDLLAKKTQLYTRALISGTEDVSNLRTTIDAIIAEIKTRRMHATPPSDEYSQLFP